MGPSDGRPPGPFPGRGDQREGRLAALLEGRRALGPPLISPCLGRSGDGRLLGARLLVDRHRGARTSRGRRRPRADHPLSPGSCWARAGLPDVRAAPPLPSLKPALRKEPNRPVSSLLDYPGWRRGTRLLAAPSPREIEGGGEAWVHAGDNANGGAATRGQRQAPMQGRGRTRGQSEADGRGR